MNLTDTDIAAVEAALVELDPDEGNWPTGEQLEAIASALLITQPKKTAIVPLARFSSTWLNELRVGCQRYWDEGFERCSSPAAVARTDAETIVLYPQNNLFKADAYSLLCEMAVTAEKKGYRLETALVGE